MDQRQRTSNDVREHPPADVFVVAGELKLRDTKVGIDQSVWMRDPDAGDGNAR
jgi:hypothetical protein